jgi:hypothetical protein
MKVGISQVDITPEPGLELSGFASRIQPSTSVLDPIYVRCLFLEDSAGSRALWIVADIVAFERGFSDSFRAWASEFIGQPHVLLSATHTHSAPATVPITGCGRVDESYLALLRSRMEKGARNALANAQQCETSFVQARLDLAVDRRHTPTAHTDPLASAIAFVRADGSYRAVMINYPMHPVALGGINRAISGDWCSETAAAASRELPGRPVALVTNGACGNINPPKTDVPPDQVRAWGKAVADAVTKPLLSAKLNDDTALRIWQRVVPVELEAMSPEEVDRVVAANLKWPVGREWAQQWRDANDTWRETQKRLVQTVRTPMVDLELFVLRLGDVHVVGVNGEIFSRFTDMVRQATHKIVVVAGYSNAAFGYIPTRAAYAEGGYEIETAHFFYNSFRPRAGALEFLAEKASDMIRQMSND